jgi:hypothetical protein
MTWRIRVRLKRIIVFGAIGLVLASLALGAIGWVGSEQALHPAYQHYEWNLATYPDLRPESIRIATENHVVLDGWFSRAIAARSSF